MSDEEWREHDGRSVEELFRLDIHEEEGGRKEERGAEEATNRDKDGESMTQAAGAEKSESESVSNPILNRLVSSDILEYGPLTALPPRP